MAESCDHGVEVPPAGPMLACPFCLDRHPAVVPGHLVFSDDDGGVTWLPLGLVHLVRVGADGDYLDVAAVPAGHPGLELPAETTDTWYRVPAEDAHSVAARIAIGRRA